MEKTESKMTDTSRYYVGDLCYVMKDDWDEVYNTADITNDVWDTELADGRKFYLFSTKYGDGQYTDQNGNLYSVDSGTIGAIKVDDIRDTESLFTTVVNGLGHIHEFPSDFAWHDCAYVDGKVYFHTVSINTGDEDDCEEEEGDE